MLDEIKGDCDKYQATSRSPKLQLDMNKSRPSKSRRHLQSAVQNSSSFQERIDKYVESVGGCTFPGPLGKLQQAWDSHSYTLKDIVDICRYYNHQARGILVSYQEEKRRIQEDKSVLNECIDEAYQEALSAQSQSDSKSEKRRKDSPMGQIAPWLDHTRLTSPAAVLVRAAARKEAQAAKMGDGRRQHAVVRPATAPSVHSRRTNKAASIEEAISALKVTMKNMGLTVPSLAIPAPKNEESKNSVSRKDNAIIERGKSLWKERIRVALSKLRSEVQKEIIHSLVIRALRPIPPHVLKVNDDKSSM